jgi:hypothetical protein
MSLPTFTATNTTFLWQHEPTINTPGGSGDSSINGYPYGTLGAKTTYPNNDLPLTWSPNAPSNLQSLSLNELFALNIPNITVAINYVFTITSGTQMFEEGNIPNINLNMYLQNTTSPFSIPPQVFSTNISTLNGIGNDAIGSTSYCSATNPNICPTFTYNAPIESNPQVTTQVYEVQVNPWNRGTSSSFDYGVNDFSLQVVLNATINIACNPGTDLDSGFCLRYCSTNLSGNNCLSSYRDYCFAADPGSTGPSIILTGNTGCQTFFTDYYSNLGPEQSIDNQISTYCNQKYGNPDIGFAGLFNTTPPSAFEKNLCACHMPQSFYDAYKASVEKEFPNFVTFIDNSGIKDKCLVSYCASSPFSSSDIRDGTDFKCKIPACIQVAQFNNNGSIGGGVSITQSTTCEAIQSGATGSTGGGGNTGSNNPLTKSFWEQHWVWVILGVGILIVLIIVILIIIAAESGSKKKKVEVEKTL